MIPNDRLSTTAAVAGFTFPVKSPLPEDKLRDWELGGRYLSDPALGLQVKLWRLQGVANADTGLVDMVVSAPGGVAPGEPQRVLFSAAGITEAALTFDQNMFPFVAYTQGATCRFYWYDPTVPGMTHTDLPAGSYNARCTLDDKRSWAVGNSDIILCYMRAGTLFARYQRERYLVEHTLRTGCGYDCELVSMAMNTGQRLQWHLRNYARTDDPGALIMVEPFLADVVLGLCRRAGIPPEYVDVTELYDDVVYGFPVTSNEGLLTCIEQLQAVFPFDKCDDGTKLRFPKRGRAPVARIPHKHLVKRAGPRLERTDEDPADMPRMLTLNHIDPEAGFSRNKQFSQRRSNLVIGTGKPNRDTSVVMTASQAGSACERLLRQAYNEPTTFKFSTTTQYSAITPADVVEVEDAAGNWIRMRIEERNEDGVIEWQARMDGGEMTYGVQRAGRSLPPPTSTSPGLVGDTDVHVVNCSPYLAQHDEVGLYVLPAAEGSGWYGAELQVSDDGGASYTSAASMTVPATCGETTTDLQETLGYQVPAQSASVRVLVNMPLASATPEQVLLGHNLAVIGDEVVQFTTATLLGMVDGRYHYQLTDLVRGMQGTACEYWPAGARFLVLDDAALFLQIDRGRIGTDLVYRAVSYSQNEDEVVPNVYAFTEATSQREWPVANVAATRQGSDVTVTWDSVARLGRDSAPYHSKYHAGHRVKFSNGHTIDTAAATATYTGAPAGVSVQVCSLNTITGEGPYSPPITP